MNNENTIKNNAEVSKKKEELVDKLIKGNKGKILYTKNYKYDDVRNKLNTYVFNTIYKLLKEKALEAQANTFNWENEEIGY